MNDKNLKPAEHSGTYDDELTDHNYDGIQEYDNPLPTWWSLSFYASIVWAGFYLVGIYTGQINTVQDDLNESQAELASIRRSHDLAQPKVEITEAFLQEALSDDAKRQLGAAAFQNKCAACHGDKGQGLIGPNLTDDNWIYGGKLTEIYKTVDKGAAAKGMPAWGGVLKQDELIGMVSFIRSLRGTNPAGAKKAEGELYKPE